MLELLRETWFVAVISGAVGALLGSLVSAVGTLLAVGRTARLKEESDRRMRVLDAQIDAVQKTAGVLVSYQMRMRYHPFGVLKERGGDLSEDDELRLIVEQGTALPAGLGELAENAWNAVRAVESAIGAVRTRNPLPGPFPDESSRDQALLRQANVIIADSDVRAADERADDLVRKYQRAANIWIQKHGPETTTAEDTTGWPDLPDWELAPKRSIAPEKLVGRREAADVDKFMLMLSLAFNDLKMAAWVLDRARGAQVQYVSDPLSPEWGQVAGMMVFAQRQMVGILHETLELVRKYSDAVESAEFKEIEERMPEGPKGSWGQIVQAARTDIKLKGRSGKRQPKDLRGWLQTVRNHTAFHYAQPEDVVRGYRKFFYESPSAPHNTEAFFSEGKNMEATRFFYADAAAQSALHLFNEYASEEIPKNAHVFNVALKHLITAYLEQRGDS